MTDAFFLALLGIAGDVLKGLATNAVIELRERHRVSSGGEVTADQLRRAVENARSSLTGLRDGELQLAQPCWPR